MPRDSDTPARESRTKQELEAIRTEAVETILLLLEEGPKTAREMYLEVGGLYQTVLGYLRHMHKGLRSIRPTGQTKGRALLWELGADPSLPDLDDELEQVFAAKRGTGPAKQIGMKRCPRVAAIHGPANHNE